MRNKLLNKSGMMASPALALETPLFIYTYCKINNMHNGRIFHQILFVYDSKQLHFIYKIVTLYDNDYDAIMILKFKFF